MEKTTSWAVFLAIVGLGYWYYSHNSRPATGRARGRSVLRANETSARGDAQWTEPETKSKAAPKPTKAKAARKPAKKAAQEIGEKVAASISGASTTGTDGDDQSPVVSPTPGAAKPEYPSGKNVSDMLDSRERVPSVLKISGSEKPARTGKPQQQRAETPQETKKQRQNRKKVEEAKQQREADEEERQVLLKQQRRTARIARGEPAKNGLQPTKAPATSAWASGNPIKEAAPATNGQLLDTYEPEPASKPQGSPGANGWANGLSEEEQLKMALEDTAWETVPKGKKQRKTKAAEEVTDVADTKPTPQEPAPVKQTPAPAAKAENKAKSENKPAFSGFEVLESIPDVSHPQDSEWGVV